MRKIAAFVPNKIGVSPGQRLRIEAWSKFLTEFGWQIDFYPFEDDKLHDILYKPGHRVAKALQTTNSYLRQLKRVLGQPECAGVFIYREASLIGPALIERLSKRLRVPIIFDIDDPVFLPYRSPVNGWMSLLKFSRKTHTLFRLSDRIIAINDLIGNYAREFNPAVSVVPNFIDTDVYKPPERQRSGDPKIVWTGSVSTLQNLTSIAGPLRILQQEKKVGIQIIANGRTSIDGLELEHRDWSPESELSCLQEGDIGIVPLLDLEWNPWKFYLKTIQYLGVGLPVVARRIGSNTEVIQDGINGFLVDSEKEWFDRLSLLIEDSELRKRMGEAARKTAVEKFSIASQKGNVARIFETVYGDTN